MKDQTMTAQSRVGQCGATAPDLARDLDLCREDLAICRADLAATQTRLEHSEEVAGQFSRVKSERDRLAAALAGYLSRPLITPRPVTLDGWRGWLIRRLQGGVAQPLPDEADPRIAQIQSSALFDGAWYLRVYPDVAKAGVNPAMHYLQHGAKEGRAPGPGFDSAFYAARYQDVRDSGVNPLLHYELIGKEEGRLPMHPDPSPAGMTGRE